MEANLADQLAQLFVERLLRQRGVSLLFERADRGVVANVVWKLIVGLTELGELFALRKRGELLAGAADRQQALKKGSLGCDVRFALHPLGHQQDIVELLDRYGVRVGFQILPQLIQELADARGLGALARERPGGDAPRDARQ